jgi:hypothetical protein
MADSSWQSEMQRRANDLIRVYNPTNDDYVVEWDRKDGVKQFRVGAKQEAVLIRYIAEKYIKEMLNKIVTEKTSEAIIKENQKRIERGGAEMDKTMRSGEQMQFEQRVYSQAVAEQKEIMATLFVGIENEYGIDRRVEEEERQEPQDFSSALEQVEKQSTQKPRPEVANPQVFKCDHPGCDFETNHHIALLAHKKTHKKEKDDKKDSK